MSNLSQDSRDEGHQEYDHHEMVSAHLMHHIVKQFKLQLVEQLRENVALEFLVHQKENTIVKLEEQLNDLAGQVGELVQKNNQLKKELLMSVD